MLPARSAPPRRTARSNEEGAASGSAGCFACPGACVRAPTKATPKTSAVSAPSPAFAPRARARASSMREEAATRTIVPARDERRM